MRTMRAGGPLVNALLVAAVAASACLGSFTTRAEAAVISEEPIISGTLEWNSGGVSRSIVAADVPGSGIVVWDRTTEASAVVSADPDAFPEVVVGGDLVVWPESGLRCYNARTGEIVSVVDVEARNVVTDGRFVVYDRFPTGGTRCWDSLTRTTRTVPTKGGLWSADMQDGLVTWVDDLRSIAEGSEPDTGFIAAWDAVTGRLTRITTTRLAVASPKTDGFDVAWQQGATTRLWDRATGVRAVPGVAGDLVFDHGVLVGFQGSSYAVREPSGSVRVVSGKAPHPEQADYSDGLLSGVFANQALQQHLLTLDVYSSVTDTLTAGVSNDTVVKSAADLVISTPDDSGPISVARIGRPVRLEGRSRFDVAVQTAESTYPRWQGVTDIVIASGDDRASADPLAAAGLCWRYDAPLMLVSSAQAPASVRAAVREIVSRNGQVTVHVVGGTVSVPDAVIAQLKASAGPENVAVDRVAAPNRYSLAAAIARRVASGHGGALPVALIANGADATKFFDAAALSSIAAAKGYPILLVERDRLPAATASFLTSTSPADVIAAGGTATMSDRVVRAASAERWAGADRYATAAVIATNATDPDRAWLRTDVVGVASVLPDALSGGGLTGHRGGPLLLSARSTLPAATSAWLATHNGEVEACWILGGADSVSSRVLSQVGRRAFD